MLERFSVFYTLYVNVIDYFESVLAQKSQRNLGGLLNIPEDYNN
jgi:hypothetical protein